MTLMRETRIAGALVDLDDTLFPQQSWLRGAWRAVVTAAPALDPNVFEDALVAVASEGSDRGRIIDRALTLVGTDAAARVDVRDLVAAFRAYRAPSLECYAGALESLRMLRSYVPVALVSDGDPLIQRGKIEALGLAGEFDAIVLSDEIGRAFRKPNVAPFNLAVDQIAARTRDCVMIGDRPDKDVAGARAAGLLGTVRVLTGEYRATATAHEATLAVVQDFAEAVAWLRPALERQPRGSGASRLRVKTPPGPAAPNVNAPNASAMIAGSDQLHRV